MSYDNITKLFIDILLSVLSFASALQPRGHMDTYCICRSPASVYSSACFRILTNTFLQYYFSTVQLLQNRWSTVFEKSEIDVSAAAASAPEERGEESHSRRGERQSDEESSADSISNFEFP